MVGQLPAVSSGLAGTERIIAYTVDGLPVTLTPTQIANLAPDALPYVLQWAVWFNGTPQASELLALYVSPVSYKYPANFAGSYAAPPITLPTASFVLDIDRQVGGTGAWTTIGTITVATDGTVTLATTGDVAISIAAGDRLRVVGPATADATVAGFAVTLKGSPNT